LKSTNTLSQYLNYLEDSYVVFSIPKFSYSINKQIVNPKKIYPIDTAFNESKILEFFKGQRPDA
jgi:predicted AAA+ superfamily ATPase